MRATRPPVRFSIALCGLLILSACGGGLANSWVNPGNWFGNSASQPVDAKVSANPLIPRRRFGRRDAPEYAGQLIDQISALRIERLPGGAIVHVTGVTDVIGYFDVRLEPENEGKPIDGVLSYAFRAVRPEGSGRVGSDAARQVEGAVSVTDQDLDGVRQITVRGARNQRTVRRP